jgi:hypothetical protein
MLNQSVSPLQIYKTTNFTGLLEQNHLANAYMTEPHKMEAVLAYAFGTYNKKGLLDLITGGLQNTAYVLDNREYSWDLHMRTDRSIPVSRVYDAANVTPGAGGAGFYLIFPEQWFSATDELVSENLTSVRVQSEPYQDGLDWVYPVQLTDPNQSYLDPTQLAAGARWTRDYSSVEEFSDKGGTVSFNSPAKLRNCLSTLRLEYTMTRSAFTDVMVVELPDPEDPSKKTKLWAKAADWEAMSQWGRDKDRNMLYSIYNNAPGTTVNLKGLNGRPIYKGAGLRQQISPANKYYYNGTLTYDFFDGVLMDLSYAAQNFGGNHKFMALTGKMGMRVFTDAIIEKYRNLGVTVVDSGRFLDGKGNNLTFEAPQFKTVKFLNGIELTLVEFEPYDDLDRNGNNLHPKTLKPLESYRFTIMNIGANGGKSNLQKVVKKDSGNIIRYVEGSTSPVAGVSSKMSSASSKKDGYEVYMIWEGGIMLKDPTASAEIILSL